MNQTIMALDVGNVRTGVAVASIQARLPHPFTTLPTSSLKEDVMTLINNEGIVALVVGLPRNLEGEETAQTRFAIDTAERLKEGIDIPVFFQDEALTSKQAESELESRGVSYTKADIDALAATLILDDFLQGPECRKFLEELHV